MRPGLVAHARVLIVHSLMLHNVVVPEYEPVARPRGLSLVGSNPYTGSRRRTSSSSSRRYVSKGGAPTLVTLVLSKIPSNGLIRNIVG